MNDPPTIIRKTWLRGHSDSRWRLGVAILGWGLLALNAYDLEGFWRGLCERAIPLVLLVLTVLTTIGCGTRVLDRLQGPRFPRRKLEHFCLSAALGLAVLGIFLCGMACVREFEPGVLVPVALLANLLFGLGFDGRPSGWDVCRDMPWRRSIQLYRRDVWTRVAGILTLLIVGVTFLWSWGPVWDYDAEMYHLPNAANLVRYHGLVVDRDHALANLPGQAYLWYAIGLSAGTEAYSALLVWWATVVTSLLAAAIASRWFGMHSAVWTLPIYWSGLIVHAVASTPRVEPLYSLMFLAAIAWLLEARQSGRLRWGTVIGCGICLGTAGGIKYQGLYGWLIIGVWWAWVWCRHREWRTAQTVLRLTGLFVIGFVVLAPWWWKNYATFGTPIYPMFARQQIDPDSLRHSNPHGPHHRTRGWNFLLIDTWDLFTKPDTFSGPPNQFPHYTFLLLPLLAVVWPRSVQRKQGKRSDPAPPLTKGGPGGLRSLAANTPSIEEHQENIAGHDAPQSQCDPRRSILATLLLLTLGYYALSLRLTHELRHLFGIFSLASILCGYVVAEFRIRWGLKVFFPGIVVATMSLVLLHPGRLTRLPGYLLYASGLRSGAALRAQVLPPAFDQAVEWCNTNTPPDAVILMCWESRCYRLHRTAIADSGGSTWTTLFRGRNTPAEVADYLHAQRVDFVLVNEASLEFNTNRSKLIPPQIRDDFRRQRKLLVPTILEPVFGARPDSPKSVTVYRVR